MRTSCVQPLDDVRIIVLKHRVAPHVSPKHLHRHEGDYDRVPVHTNKMQPLDDVHIITLSDGTRFRDDECVDPHVASESVNWHEHK